MFVRLKTSKNQNSELLKSLKLQILETLTLITSISRKIHQLQTVQIKTKTRQNGFYEKQHFSVKSTLLLKKLLNS